MTGRDFAMKLITAIENGAAPPIPTGTAATQKRLAIMAMFSSLDCGSLGGQAGGRRASEASGRSSTGCPWRRLQAWLSIPLANISDDLGFVLVGGWLRIPVPVL
jgi:hypothetical protein